MSLLLCTAMAVQLSAGNNTTVHYGGVGLPPKREAGTLAYGGVGLPPKRNAGDLAYGGVGLPPKRNAETLPPEAASLDDVSGIPSRQ
jgi:hypothetical protein